MRRVTVLVCGDPMRGDDAVADAIVAALPVSTRLLARVRHVWGLTPDDLVEVDGPLIVLDAAVGPAPGEVIDLPLAALPASAGGGAGSSHTIPLTASVALAEQIAGHPLEGRFIGIAGERFDLGEPLTAVVAEALPKGAARLGHWIRVLTHAQPVATCA